MVSLTDKPRLVTLREALDNVTMLALMQRLGFPVPERGSRTQCLICGSENPTCFSWKPDGRWHCFRCGESGGKLKLVEQVLKTNCRGAIAWLDLEFTLGLRRTTWTTAQRRAWAERRRRDERDTPNANWWRMGALRILDAALESEKRALVDRSEEPALDNIGEMIGTLTRLQAWVMGLRDLDAYRRASSIAPNTTRWLVSEGRTDDEDAQLTAALVVNTLARATRKLSE